MIYFVIVYFEDRDCNIFRNTAHGLIVGNISSWTNILLASEQDCESLGHPLFPEGHYPFSKYRCIFKTNKTKKNFPGMAHFHKYPFYSPTRIILNCI